jgi:hypothetical protein
VLKLAAYLPKPVHPSTWRVDSPTFASGKISRPPLPLQKALKAVLSAGTAGPERKLRASSYADPDLLFATRKGAPLDAQTIVNLHFKPLLKHADLPLFVGTISGTHALRCFWGAAFTRNSSSTFLDTPA